MQLFKKIEEIYWDIVPYQWRPMQVWYSLRGFFWDRFKVVKPRTIKGWRWVDSDYLLIHCIMEILSRFLEDECNQRRVDWYYTGDDWDGNKTEFEGQECFVIDVFWSIYHWWRDDYLVNYDNCYDEWHEYRQSNNLRFFDFEDGQDANEEQEKESTRLFEIALEKERGYDQKLTKYLTKIIELKDHMWT